MSVLLVRNETPGPLVLVDEDGNNRQEYNWQPAGTPGSRLEVPKKLSGNVNFRRNVQKGNLAIEEEISDDLALMGPNDADWVNRQLGSGSAESSVPGQVMGETRTADGVPVIIDKTQTQPISTIKVDDNGDIINVEEISPEQRQEQRAREARVPQTGVPTPQITGSNAPQPTPEPQPFGEGVPEVAGGHLDPNSP